uniref:Uncharacterized protein n=1 Tax=Lygus hesperus TaxID=30085 RepID=A0A146LHU4_LYGHE
MLFDPRPLALNHGTLNRTSFSSFRDTDMEIREVITTERGQIQAETTLKLSSIKNGRRGIIKKSTQDELTFLITCWEDFQEDRNTLEYLKNVGPPSVREWLDSDD